jgi:hypothetical protein
MNYAEIGKKAKRANPGAYDAYSDEEVGIAYTRRYLATFWRKNHGLSSLV